MSSQYYPAQQGGPAFDDGMPANPGMPERPRRAAHRSVARYDDMLHQACLPGYTGAPEQPYLVPYPGEFRHGGLRRDPDRVGHPCRLGHPAAAIRVTMGCYGTGSEIMRGHPVPPGYRLHRCTIESNLPAPLSCRDDLWGFPRRGPALSTTDGRHKVCGKHHVLNGSVGSPGGDGSGRNRLPATAGG